MNRTKFERINLTKEIAYEWFIIFLMNRQLVQYIVQFIFVNILKFRGVEIVINTISGIFILAPIIVFSIGHINDVRPVFGFALLYIIMFIVFQINLLIYPNYEIYYTRSGFGLYDCMFSLTKGGIWYFLAFNCLMDIKKPMKTLRIASALLVILSLYQIYRMHKVGYWMDYNSAGVYVKTDYNLNLGYQLVFSCIVFLYTYIKERKLYCLGASVFSFVLILQQGSRGPLLCLTVFVCIYLLRSLTQLKLLFRILISCFLVAGYYFFSLYWYNIASWLAQVIFGTNASSRTIRMLLDGTWGSDSGRTAIQSLCWDYISKQGIGGLGLFGSRSVIAPLYYWGYPHNIFIEMIMELGWIPAILTWVILGYSIYRIVIKAEGKELTIFFVLLAMNTKLMVSDSFWGYSFFWGMLGWMFRCLKRKRRLMGITSKTVQLHA